MKKNILTEISRIKELMPSNLIMEQAFYGQILKRMTVLVGNIDSLVAKFGDDVRRPLEELVALTDDTAKLSKLEDIATKHPELAKELRTKIFSRLTLPTQTAVKDIVDHINGYSKSDVLLRLDQGLDAYFQNATKSEKDLIERLVRDLDDDIDDAIDVARGGTRGGVSAGTPPLSNMGWWNRFISKFEPSIQDKIRREIPIYANKTDDEIAKIIKTYENGATKNAKLAEQLDEIFRKKGFVFWWRKQTPWTKLTYLISLPVFGPAVIQFLVGLTVLYVNNYAGLWDLPIYRFVTTGGGLFMGLEEAKNAAPEEIQKSIYENEENGEIFIYVSDTEKYPVVYDFPTNKWCYVADGQRYLLSEY